jgi:Tfp pilus assembly protein PilW
MMNKRISSLQVLRAAGGHTLIELMVSTVIAAVIMIGVNGMLLENTRFDSREKSRLVLMREAREAVSVIGDGMVDAAGTFRPGFRGMNAAGTQDINTPWASINAYVWNAAPQTGNNYLLNAPAYAPDASGNGKTMTIWFTDPDLNARLGTMVVQEAFWCFFANNVGLRMQ